MKDHLSLATKTLPQWLIVPASIFLMTRSIVWLSGYFAEGILPSAADDRGMSQMPNNIWLDIWARWDSGWYLSIINRGYFYDVGKGSSIVFFPLYPLLVSSLNALLHNSVVSGIIVSNVCLFLALVYLYRLAEFEFDSATATRTVFYIASFPASFFFSAVYTESTFLLFSVATMYYARKRQWAWASLMGVWASATRVIGCILVIALMFEWLCSAGWNWRQVHSLAMWKKVLRKGLVEWHNLTFIGLISLGVLSYIFFLYQNFGDPIAFWHGQIAWRPKSTNILEVILGNTWKILNQDWMTGKIKWLDTLDLASFMFVFVLGFAVLRRLGASYAIFTFLSILIPANSALMSLFRYVGVIFPVFMVLGDWGRRTWLDRFINMLFCVFLGICTAVFVNKYFIG